MSRIIVRNIPANATPESLRSHLSSTKLNAPTITDVHVARKADGTPRKFAFVGFKTEEQAMAAKEWYHQSFWGTQRITVELAQGMKDAPASRPNKRPRLAGFDGHLTPIASNSTKLAKSVSQNSDTKPKVESKSFTKTDDAVTNEFLSLSRRKKGPVWADGPVVDDVVMPSTHPDGNIKSVGTIFLSKKDEPAAPETQDIVTQAEVVSDLEWMKSRMNPSVREPKDFEQSDDEGQQSDGTIADTDKAEASHPVDEREVFRQTISSTRRLFVRNLTFSCTLEELQALFSRFGQIEQLHIPIAEDRSAKGIAFVLFATAEDAVAAWEALDGTSFQGRLLHIIAGVERRKAVINPPNGTKASLKEEKTEKRKKDAGKSFNWAMLYMNSDAVASSIANRMNISKADILSAFESEDTSSQNPAVKLALAETHIIQETKRYFEEQGVVLETFVNGGIPRSKTVILVKNIPYGTSTETLRSMFEQHGEISRLLLPPSGTLAVIEFAESDDANNAFRSLAYRRLGNSIIYLEWAPEGLIMQGVGREPAQIPIKPVTIREQEEGIFIESEPLVSVPSGSTLFIKNLSFSTTSERLAQVFRGLAGYAFARVQMKPTPKTQPEREKLSMGYGFVGFRDVDSAKKALKSMQGFVLDGHKLLVSFAGRGKDEERKGDAIPSKAKTAKMIVKNLPFEASKKDLRDLFGVYGTLKSVRLPKKFDSRSRGFGFLEFVSRHEAENAFAALRHTHLLGRHLVLEWAEEGEQDIEALRRKVGVGFGGGSEMPGRKRKLNMAIGEEGEEEV